MMIRVTDVFAASLTDFTRGWPRLLVIDLLYKIFAFVLLTPLVGLTLKLSMAIRGSTVVADWDMLYFALSPTGLLALIVAGAIGIAIVATEQACLMAIGFGELRQLRVRASESGDS